jgi:hypothetical protein
MGLLKVYAMPIALGHAAGCKRARTEPPARKSFSKKNLDSDDHFDRPFLFIAVKGKPRKPRETDHLSNN